MENEEIRQLLKKYNEGRCTEEERAVLEVWYLEYNEETDINLSPREIHAMQHRVFRELPGNQHEFWKTGLRLAAAAVLIGIVVTVTIKLALPPGTPAAIAQDIAPGKNKAVLTLADGRKISLTDAVNGQVAGGPIRIMKTGKGEVTYQVVAKSRDGGSNTITTPNGGQWRVVLPDGTKVWLNAASSFTYPASFNGPDRIVHL